MAGSAAWSTITDWQRRGLVRLRWGGSRDYCFVSLTDAGQCQAASDKAATLA